jgi:hypothetical protein
MLSRGSGPVVALELRFAAEAGSRAAMWLLAHSCGIDSVSITNGIVAQARDGVGRAY